MEGIHDRDKPAGQIVAEFLTALNSDDRIRLPEAIFELNTEADRHPLQAKYMGRLVREAWKSLVHASGLQTGRRLVDLARRGSSREDVSWHVRTALDYLAAWSEVRRVVVEKNLAPIQFQKDLASSGSLLDLNEQMSRLVPRLGTRYGAGMVRAIVTSINDRASAADLFRAAWMENPEFAKASLIDWHAATYFSQESIRRSTATVEERRTRMAEDVELASSPSSGGGGKTLLLFSCDLTYFRVHFPYWISAIQYLSQHGIEAHFILVGNREAVGDAIKECAEVISLTATLRGTSPLAATEHVSFSRVSTPGYVTDPKTFFACARFLLARQLGRNFEGQMLILDSDMMLREDPRLFLRRLHDLSESRLPLVIAGGLSSLIPAHRYPAVTFPIPRREWGDQIMHDIEDYIYAGLDCSVSWTLDQNAITYAVERLVASQGADLLFRIHELGRPFVQWTAVKGMFTETQRRLEKSSEGI